MRFAKYADNLILFNPLPDVLNPAGAGRPFRIEGNRADRRQREAPLEILISIVKYDIRLAPDRLVFCNVAPSRLAWFKAAPRRLASFILAPSRLTPFR